MKTKLEYWILLSFALICTALLQSCNNNSIEGDGEFMEMKVSQNAVSFNSTGGTVFIECLVSNTFHVDCISDMLTETIIYGRTSTDITNDPEEIKVDGILVKRGENKRQVIITVSPSEKKRKWMISLLSGPLVADITVSQGD